jgi:hypothetical protein
MTASIKPKTSTTLPDKTFQKYKLHLFDDILNLTFQLRDIKIRSNKYRHQIGMK